VAETRLGKPAAALYLLLGIATLYLAREMLIPIALAILFTFLLSPLVTRLQRVIRHRGVAMTCVVFAVLLVLGAGTAMIGHQFISLAASIPEYRETITRKVRAVRDSTRGVMTDAAKTIRAIGTDVARPSSEQAPASVDLEPAASAAEVNALPTPSSTGMRPVEPDDLGAQNTIQGVASVVSPILSPFATALVVILLVMMMLPAKENIRDRVIRLAGLHHVSLTTQALEEAGARVAAYLRAQFLINLFFGSSVAIGLLLTGIPSAAALGVAAGLLRFVPIVGPWLGATVPAILSIALFDDWTHLILVVALFSCLELLTNLVLEPWFYGVSTGISSLGVVVAIIFWTWIWGPVGLVLAMPMTVCVMVFARQLPPLAMIPILLGDEPVLSEPLRFFHRLLAGNEDEAASILRKPPFVSSSNGAATGDRSVAALPAAAAAASPNPGAVGTLIDPLLRLDTIVVPTLSAIRHELAKGTITETQAVRTAQSLRDVVVDWLGDHPVQVPAASVSSDGSPTDATTGSPAPASSVVIDLRQSDVYRVACLPVIDEIDQCAADVLAECLQRKGHSVFLPPPASLLREMLAGVADSGVNVVFLSAVVPAGLLHTRRVCKAIRRRMPGVKVIVCHWNMRRGEPADHDLTSGADVDVSSFTEAIDAVARLASPAPAPTTGA